MGVIYAAINLIENIDGIYIGSSIDFETRLTAHYQVSKSKKEQTTKFNKALREFGWENFEFVIIEQNDLKGYSLKWKEREYILRYNTIESGYNTTLPIDNKPLTINEIITEKCYWCSNCIDVDRKLIHYKKCSALYTPVKNQIKLGESLDDAWLRIVGEEIRRFITNEIKCKRIINKQIVSDWARAFFIMKRCPINFDKIPGWVEFLLQPT